MSVAESQTAHANLDVLYRYEGALPSSAPASMKTGETFAELTAHLQTLATTNKGFEFDANFIQERYESSDRNRFVYQETNPGYTILVDDESHVELHVPTQANTIINKITLLAGNVEHEEQIDAPADSTIVIRKVTTNGGTSEYRIGYIRSGQTDVDSNSEHVITYQPTGIKSFEAVATTGANLEISQTIGEIDGDAFNLEIQTGTNAGTSVVTTLDDPEYQ